MSLLRLQRLAATWKSWLFGQESEVLSDSAALQVKNVSNGENSDLQQHSKQHYQNLQAVQDHISHTLEPASSSMVRIQKVLFTFMPSQIRRKLYLWVRLLTHFLCSYIKCNKIQSVIIHPADWTKLHMLFLYNLCVCAVCVNEHKVIQTACWCTLTASVFRCLLVQ